MSFWDNVFQAPQPASPPLTSGQSRAWWQEPEPYQQFEQPSSPRAGEQYVLSERERDARLNQIRKRGHNQISSEEAEMIAEHDLATKAKYQNVCDQCGSGNFVLAGQRIAGVIMPTNKCFNCGNSARSPEPAVGGGSGKGSIHTRQIDTGGAGGTSMFMKFNGVPRSYAPRA